MLNFAPVKHITITQNNVSPIIRALGGVLPVFWHTITFQNWYEIIPFFFEFWIETATNDSSRNYS